jgi:serralysin
MLTQSVAFDGDFLGLDAAEGFANAFDQSLFLTCGCSTCLKALDAFPGPDGVGDVRPPVDLSGLILTTDSQPGDTTTTAALTVDGPAIVSSIETVGDVDYFKIDLVAGQTYEIGMYAKVGGPNAVFLADAYFTLYAPDGTTELVQADGGASTTLNTLNSGFDALLTFEATQTGTFYIKAQAFDNDPIDGTNGEGVGDYELFARTVAPNDTITYRPFYSPDSPLHSLDWGSQVDGTVRNPDGDNGTRRNGVRDTGTVVDPVTGIEGKNVITYYFARTGDVFLSEDPLNPGLENTVQARDMLDWEKQAFRNAFDLYEQVADLVYIEVDDRTDADFKIILYEGTPGVGASLLGRMSPPGEQNEGQTEINSGDLRWTEEGVAPGGFYFPTLLHELGHGHGLAHPHDNGGRSSVMRGVEPGTGGLGGSLGAFDLNQQVHTVMAYNDGWTTSPYGQPSSDALDPDNYGWVGTLSPLDIAVIQDKYGVNEEWATGDDVFVLRDVNEAGTYYKSIWDGGGTDEIRYDGARDTYIDLRAATLAYEEGGGGRVSYADGIFGGYTIANGVKIENARSGAGDDRLIGNQFANALRGGGGDDTLAGGGGRDQLFGGLGADRLVAGAARDRLEGGADADVFVFGPASLGRDVIADFQTGVDKIDLTDLGLDDFGSVKLLNRSAGVLVKVDADGDGAFDDLSFLVKGTNPVEGDFLI